MTLMYLSIYACKHALYLQICIKFYIKVSSHFLFLTIFSNPVKENRSDVYCFYVKEIVHVFNKTT